MSRLTVDKKKVLLLFSDDESNFLIPDYQRPYAWGENECLTLWDDLFNFSFPDDKCNSFDNHSDYFLGPIVTFKNADGKKEIIDGQQRLTTLMLLLRAFYDSLMKMQDEEVVKTRENIEKCIWETDEFDRPIKSKLKINSEVATDNDKEEFLEILEKGTVDKNQKSRYAKNFLFFQEKIEEFLHNYPSWFSYFPTRIMKNCILLPIEAESQDTALRIFSTLNDRGKPLSDADIFKAQLYKYYSDKNVKDDFIEDWKYLEGVCIDLFPSTSGSSLDEIFTRYMYYERAKSGIKSSTTEGLRKFYENNDYGLLKNDETFTNIIDLANFWNDVDKQNEDKFSDEVLKRLFILNYAPNSMWTYFVSVYYLTYRDDKGYLNNEDFCNFLNKITAFIWTYTVTNHDLSALRAPVYAEMVNIVNKQPVTFNEYLFDAEKIENAFDDFEFSNNRKITRSMLTWWVFQKPEQPLLELGSRWDIEHIYAKNRYKKENSLSNPKNLESLGNKSLLERGINIRASDYHFEDKRKYYLEYKNKHNQKEGTEIVDLRNIAETKSDFTELDIKQRYIEIVDGFIEFLDKNDLLIKE